MLEFWAVASLMGSDFNNPERYNEDQVIEDRDSSRNAVIERSRNAKIRNAKAQGLTEFFYGENKSLWALNKKNADRKARKLNWL